MSKKPAIERPTSAAIEAFVQTDDEATDSQAQPRKANEPIEAIEDDLIGDSAFYASGNNADVIEAGSQQIEVYSDPIGDSAFYASGNNTDAVESGSQQIEVYNERNTDPAPLPSADSADIVVAGSESPEVGDDSAEIAVTPEIEGFEGELVGEAVMKSFIPGQTYFDYRNLLNTRVAKSTNPDERRTAIYNSQVWLLCQCYEVVEPSGKTRPLGLDDVECMDGETLAFTVSNLVAVDVDINFLDEKNNLEYSELFEITEKAQRFKIERLSVQKAVEIQELSREDPTGVKLSQWMICNKILLNNERIKLEDFKTKLDMITTVVLVQKADFLLKPYLAKKPSFTIRDTRAGRTRT